MNLRHAIGLLLCAMTLMSGGCSGDVQPSGAASGNSPSSGRHMSTIEITGASTIGPLMTEIGKRFESLHPEVRVNVQMGGTSRGIADARKGLADIGMASRDLKPDENDLQRFLIARDGVCLILHATNPVTELSDEQVVGIYTGQIENWKEVGGTDVPITVVNKAEGRSTLEVFAGYFKLKNQDIQADVVIGDNEQGVKTVAGSPHAIGYVSIGTAEFDRQSGVTIKLLPIKGIEASTKNVANGSFPISRTLNLVTKAEPVGAVKELIEFAQSAAVHDLVKELSFVPIEN